jgi:hypothetical protein
MKIKFFIIFLLLTFSCENRQYNSSDSIDRFNSTNEEEMSMMKQKLAIALNKGDFKLYNEASNFFLLRGLFPELYFYAFLMANKYNCPEAYYHLYLILTIKIKYNSIVFPANDKSIRSYAYYYLLKSYELGFDTTKIIVKDIFGDNIPESESFMKITNQLYGGSVPH